MRDDIEGLPKRIKQARKAAKMSRARLGKYLGVSRQAVAKWEGEDRHSEPKLAKLREIATVLRVNFLWLLTGGHYVPSVEGPWIQGVRL